MARGATLPGTAQHPGDDPDLRPGVSVIVPSHQGRDHIGRCLRSLAIQTLDRDLFEIIVVLNGKPDGTRAVLDGLCREQPDLDIRIHEVAEASASRARNMGVATASRIHTTFVDDDDSVSPAFLETLLTHAAPGVVPLAHIVDVNGAGHVDPATRINTQTLRFTGRTVHPAQVPRAVGFNACKLIPTRSARTVLYDTDLHSGVDVVFFMSLLAHRDFHLYVCPVESGPQARNAVYYRQLRPNSMSRQPLSFDFHVTGRMEIITRLDTLIARCDDRRRLVLQHGINAQVSFINRYLAARPGDLDRVLGTVDSYAVENFPYHRLARGLAKTLVVSYCFPPYSTTSGIVMAKRIRARKEIVDVVYNAMDSARNLDESTAWITRGMIDRDIRLPTATRFAHWRAVEEFCMQGLARLEAGGAAKAEYERIYSRVTWPASHFLAAMYKARHPAVRWSAEFSDPVSRGVDGRERTMPITEGPVLDQLRDGLRAWGLPPPGSTNAFRWCEHLAYALADEVVFTNESQMDYMLGYCDDRALAERVRAKAVIQPQPTLPSEFYAMVGTTYPLAGDAVNLAYFGAFYATRGIDDVLNAMAGLDGGTRCRLRLHIFTGSAQDVRGRADELGVAGSIVVSPYVPYLEFLSLSTRFDWLVATDAVTSGSHPCNPYLPSKWSDYRGSGTPVWGLVEPGSPLSRQPLDHLTALGDVVAARRFLTGIVQARFLVDPAPVGSTAVGASVPTQRSGTGYPSPPAVRPATRV